MMKIVEIFKRIDMFGVPVQLKYAGQNSYKSTIGGITTLILYSLSLAYAVMIFYQWGNNEMLPKVQTYVQTIQKGRISLQPEFMTVGFFNSSVSAFNQSACLILPLLFEVHSNYSSNPVPLFENVGKQSSHSSQLLIKLPQLSVSTQDLNSLDSMTFQQYFLLLTPCSPFLSEQYNYTCAPESQIREFIRNAPPVLEITIQANRYNPDMRQNQVITQQHYVVFEPDSGHYETIMFRSQLQQVDSGILFQNFEQSTHVSSFNIMNQQISATLMKKIFYMESYTAFFFQMDNLQDGLTVVEIKLSEILAMIGSITAILLTVGNSMNILNKHLLKQDISVNLLNNMQGIHTFDNQLYKQIQKKLLGQLNILNILNNLNQINKQLDINHEQYNFDALLRVLEYDKLDEEMILKSESGAQTPQPSEENKPTPVLILQYSKQKKTT